MRRLIGIFIAVACTYEKPKSLDSLKTQTPQSLSEYMQHYREHSLVDLKTLAAAQTAEKSQPKHAHKLWRELALRSRRYFGELAYDKWLTRKGSEEEDLDRYAKKQKIITLPKWRKTFPKVSEIQELAKFYCQDRVKQDHNWFRELEHPIKLCLEAAIDICEHNPEQALVTLKELAPALSLKQETKYLTVYVYQQLTLLMRRLDQRELAADYYKKLIKSWQDPAVSPKSLGLSESEFYFQRVNDFLWAARYRAMIKDYSGASKILRTVEKELGAPPRGAERGQLQDYRAEYYHTKASRIFLEKKDYAQAAAVNRLALNSDISKEWRERFLWYLGLYEYLGKGDAEKVWLKLLEEDPGEKLKLKVMFWLARIYYDKGERKKSLDLLDEIRDANPLSFYWVVAPKLAGLPTRSQWFKPWSDLRKSAKRLEKNDSYSVDSLRESTRLGPQLKKVEILLLANQVPWAVAASRDLHRDMLRNLARDRNIPEYIYLSRLYHVQKEYFRSVKLTQQLEDSPNFWLKWPEQIFIAFPRPYMKSFAHAAGEQGLDQAILYAVARQESRFEVEAASYAWAYGLMQLIRPTAKSMAVELDLKPGVDFNQPETNLRLGASYINFLLKRYQQDIMLALAAYNAGEYVVDLWQQRRHHTDQLMRLELIPYGQTRNYVIKTMLNLEIYRYINTIPGDIAVRLPGYLQQYARKAAGKRGKMKN